MSGYCATARENKDTPPIRIIRIAMTLERTGRSMKNFEIMAAVLFRCSLTTRLDFLQLRIYLLAGDRAQQPGDNDAVIGLQAAFDDAQVAFERPGLHLSLLDDVFAGHGKQISSSLIAAQRDIGYEQRVIQEYYWNAEPNIIYGLQVT